MLSLSTGATVLHNPATSIRRNHYRQWLYLLFLAHGGPEIQKHNKLYTIRPVQYSSNISSNTYVSALVIGTATPYSHRAYATNTAGTGYAQASFTTDAINAPVATAANQHWHSFFRANWNSVPVLLGHFLMFHFFNILAPVTNRFGVLDQTNPDDATADMYLQYLWVTIATVVT